MSDRLERRERRRLRLRLALFLLAVAVPSGLLLLKALDQLKWEALRQTQLAAEALTRGIDERLDALVREQDRHSFAAFSFLTIAGDPAAGFVQRSPLAVFPVESALPGLIGWFQIDAAGGLSTPLLPAAGSDAGAYGIDAAELAGRQQLERRIGSILGSNAVAGRAESEPEALQTEVEPADVGAPAAAPPAEGLSSTTGRVAADAATQRDVELERPAPASTATPDESPRTKSVAEGQALFDRLFSRGRSVVNEGDVDREDARVEIDMRKDGTRIELPSPAQEQARTGASAPVESDAVAHERRRAPRREQAALPEPPPATASTQVAAATVDEVRQLPEPEALAARSPVETLRADRAAAEPSVKADRPPGAPLVKAVPRPALPQTAAPDQTDIGTRPIIRTFESELGPFRFDRLDSGHFVLYRWAWRDGARYVQGALIEAASFLSALIGAPFEASALSRAASLEVTWGNGGAAGPEAPLASYAARPGEYEAYSSSPRMPAGTRVYRGRLTEPFGALRLQFDALRLPNPPGAMVIYWLGLVLALVLLAGGFGLYRVGLRQIVLARQQRDFVAAVSHELKTPLTAIRMYSEMLREGWASEDKRPGYYRYIHDEAERLSRLVANVLQLARMTRDELHLEPRPVTLSALLEQARPTLANLTEQAGFELMMDCDSDCEVYADPDAVAQVLINLVDNGIKFTGRTAPASARRIVIRCAAQGDALISVRDQGPGIPRQQRRRALALFQRLENEATRETKGTGIGLALVQRLMLAMDGRISLHDANPGLEVRLHLSSMHA